MDDSVFSVSSPSISILIFQLLERLPRVIWIIIKCALPGTSVQHYSCACLFSVACIYPLIEAESPFYYYDDTVEMIALYTMHHGKIVSICTISLLFLLLLLFLFLIMSIEQTHTIGPAIVMSCAVTALCYAVVIVRDLMVCYQAK